ncbi:MAG: hypothetical protein ACU0C9_09450 [Paracoccaceae bacterium]
MSENPKDNPDGYPAIGRLLLWVDRPGSAKKIFWALAGICLLLFLIDFTFEKHGKFDIENLPGFYGVYGFISFTGLIFVAKALRVLIKRPEDFYQDKAIDTEDYPASGLDRIDHDV